MSDLLISNSQISMYKDCPCKYYFRYVKKIPEKQKYFFAFGTALHKVMEYLYSNPQNTQPFQFQSLENILNFFQDYWNQTDYLAKGYPTQEKHDQAFLEGQKIIKNYYNKHLLDDRKTLSTELRLVVNINGLNVQGIVDRIDYLDNGKVCIIDYKTGKTLQHDPAQLMMYQKILQNTTEILPLIKKYDDKIKDYKVSSMLFYHLPTLASEDVKPAPENELNAFWKDILHIVDNIEAQKFEPKPSNMVCKWCDYRGICPVYADEQKNTFHNINNDANKQTNNSINSDAELSLFSSTKSEDLSIKNTLQKNLKEETSLSEEIDNFGKLTEIGINLRAKITELMSQNSQNIAYGTLYKAELKEKQEITLNKKMIDIILKLLNKQPLTDEENKKLTQLNNILKQTKLYCTKVEK